MARDFTFGAGPERLKRLLFEGLEEPERQEDVTKSISDHTIKSAGERIGRYRLIRTIGEGGMGIVYLAEQVESIRRKVALKVIKPGMDSKRVMARFEAERQALALLDHPNIAHVYDAGTTEAGRPFFVMEHVKGLPITEYCDRHKLTIEERLRLYQQVCQAVQHAHQKGIIHRDIKPSNILVSTQDDKAVPKIIDFGVAKALAQPLTERTLATEDSQLLGTPEYMSPEQADMAIKDIDTRSDIYSLGVLLYVLLTGVLPFDSDTLRTGGIERIRQVIRETDPKTPSTRLNKLGEEALSIAQNRRMEVQTLTKHLKKELEWIPLKAMRKERSERYRSASELADDIQNYLKGAPLIAGPESTIYLFKKFVKRKRGLVTGIAAVMAVLVAGIVVSTILAIGQARARADAELITKFLNWEVLNTAGQIMGREATMVDALNVVVAKLDKGKLREEPLIEAQIRRSFSSTYYRLGNFKTAAIHQKRVYDIHREQYGEENKRTRGSIVFLAMNYRHSGRYKEAESLYKQAIEMALREKSRGLTIYLSSTKCYLATCYEALGRYEEAEELLRKALESDDWEKDSWPESERMAQFGHHLANIYRNQGRYNEAENMYLISLKNKSMRFLGKCTVLALNGLGLLRLEQGRFDDAEDLFKRGIEVGNSELPGKGHPWKLRNVNGLAVLRTKQKKYEDAKRLFHEALEGRILKLGEDHPETLESKNDLAILYKEQGDYDKAEPLLQEALEGRRLKLGDTHPHTLESWNNLIDLYEAWNKPEKANEWRAKLPQTEAVEK